MTTSQIVAQNWNNTGLINTFIAYKPLIYAKSTSGERHRMNGSV